MESLANNIIQGLVIECFSIVQRLKMSSLLLLILFVIQHGGGAQCGQSGGGGGI